MKPERVIAAVERFHLYLLPPAGGQGWVARTVGGIHDPAPLVGSGSSPAAAVEDALGYGAEPELEGQALDLVEAPRDLVEAPELDDPLG